MIDDLDKAALASNWEASAPHPPKLHRFCLPQSALSSLCSLSNADKSIGNEDVEEAIAEAVKLTLPRDVHQNHKALFTLARAVKAIEVKLGRPFSERELSATFEKWHQAAKSFLRLEQSRDEYWFEFLEGYDNVKYPLGEGLLKTAWEAALEHGIRNGREKESGAHEKSN